MRDHTGHVPATTRPGPPDIRHVIDNRCGLVNPANPCRCGRQIQAGLDVFYLDRANLPLARHPRQPDDTSRQTLDTLANQIDVAVAIGELYRAGRFAAPAQIWQDLRQACPDLVQPKHSSDRAANVGGGPSRRPADTGPASV